VASLDRVRASDGRCPVGSGDLVVLGRDVATAGHSLGEVATSRGHMAFWVEGVAVAGDERGVAAIWSLHGAEGHDPDRWGRGTPSASEVSRSRPLSWITSRSGWDRTRVLSVRIWTVGVVPVAAVVRYRLVRVIWRWVSV
jgi:hypothetical protein